MIWRCKVGVLLAAGASACVGGAQISLVPAGLPAEASLVIVRPTRATFIFPVDTGTTWRWPDTTIFMANYTWGATVFAGDTGWVPVAKLYQASHPAPFHSLAHLIATMQPELLFNPGGHMLIGGTEARVKAQVFADRVVITLDGASTVARVFRARPDSVRMGSGTPLGPYRGTTAPVRHENN